MHNTCGSTGHRSILHITIQLDMLTHSYFRCTKWGHDHFDFLCYVLFSLFSKPK